MRVGAAPLLLDSEEGQQLAGLGLNAMKCGRFIAFHISLCSFLSAPLPVGGARARRDRDVIGATATVTQTGSLVPGRHRDQWVSLAVNRQVRVPVDQAGLRLPVTRPGRLARAGATSQII